MNNDEIRRVKEAVYVLLRLNNHQLTDEQKEKYDSKLEEIIKEDFEYDEADFRVISGESSLGKIGDKCLPIALKLYAIVEDNLETKEDLEKAGFLFYTSGSKMNLFALEKKLSSRFSREEYVRLMTEQIHVVKRFYNSLHFYNEEEQEQLLNDFAEILHNNIEYALYPNAKETGFNTYNNILTARNMTAFGKEFLMGLNDQQKTVIDSLNFRLEEEHLKKIKELLTKYPHKVFNIELRGSILDNFTVDEIGNMSLKDIELYDWAMKESCLEKMKEVLKINPSFDCPKKFVIIEIFRTLDAETIAGLTRAGIEEICEIKIPKSSQAVIFPVRKINRAVARDNKRKEKDDKEKRSFFRF